MMRVFADTYFFLALLGPRDAAHAAAVRWQRNPQIREVVTTSWVLLELADAMHLPHEREVAARFMPGCGKRGKRAWRLLPKNCSGAGSTSTAAGPIKPGR